MKRYLLAAAWVAALPFAARAAAPGNVEALIKSVPHLGAGAFALGMTRDDAIVKLKAEGLLSGNGAYPSIGFHFRQLSGQDFLAGSYGTTGVRPQGREEVALVYTMYPSAAVVAALSRTTGYTAANAPNVANTIAALRGKYGHENDSHESVLTWLFDESGHVLAAAEVQKVKRACMGSGDSVGSFIGAADWGMGNRLADKERLGRKIAVGYVPTRGGAYSGGYGAGQPFNDICLHVIYMHARFVPQRPSNKDGFGDGDFPQSSADWPRMDNDLVSSRMVYINDVPLDYAASEASRVAVLAGGAQHEQQQQNEAKKNKPNL